MVHASPLKGRLRRAVLTGVRHGKTPWRAWLNAVVDAQRFEGRWLDVGAGAVGTASYHGRMAPAGAFVLHSVDRDHARSPTVVADVERDGLPWPVATFDGCIAYNVFEHLAEPQPVLAEIARVLRPGGRLLLAVPFLYRIHGDPDDHHRFTATALDRMLRRGGFDAVEVEALGTGPALAALQLLWFALPTFLAAPAVQIAAALDGLAARRSRGGHYTGLDHPLGYHVVAVRSATETPPFS